jgi:hypothetical protein
MTEPDRIAGNRARLATAHVGGAKHGQRVRLWRSDGSFRGCGDADMDGGVNRFSGKPTIHAATAFRSANLIHERRRAEEEVRKARDELPNCSGQWLS